MPMRIITKVLKGKCVYWAPDKPDIHGKMTFEDAIEVKCRWDDITELITDRTGKQYQSRSRVFVDRDMELGGVLWNGLLDNIVEGSENLPFKNKGAGEIKGWDKIGTLKLDQYVRIARI